MCEALVDTPEFRVARCVCFYSGLPDEMPLDPLFERCRKEGKPALFPRIEGDALVFAPVADREDLVPGRYGVLAPHVGIAGRSPGGGDLVLVPGRAFDRRGNRLGRGAGFYDRSLPRDRGLGPEGIAGGADGSGPILFGIAWAHQIVETVPAGDGDRRVRAIVSERGVVRVEPVDPKGRESSQ